ncbi:hypothetical protein DRO24_05135 [Candidatus Bathyarchaeota archaeon]|nr:MAG: hypothetical protein DRO24_05135 [Candidatus Bathyarchaeota archaeon]
MRVEAETTYHRDKIYVPREVRERLRLRDGDRIWIEILNEDEARLVIVQRVEASKRLLKRLQSPPDLGRVMGELRREALYEDID